MIKLTKKSNSLFLAVILVAGTIVAFSPSFMTADAQSESYYGMDKDRKDVNVKSIKCNNVNVNINGLELNVLPPSLSTLLTGGEADDNAYSYGRGERNYGSGQSGSETDFRFICINNNNNTVIGEEQILPTPPTPPEPTTASLRVIKTTTCNVQVFGTICNFNPPLTITGNNPTPSSFSASDTPVVVTLGAGAYSISEEGFVLGQQPCSSGFGFEGGQDIGQIGSGVIPCTNFSDDCSGDISIGRPYM